MKRWPTGLALAVYGAACAGGSEPVPEEAITWSGPAVSARDLPDGGLELELMAPTAGHRFELGEVSLAPGFAEVRCRHTTPGRAIVAQVLTPLRVVVPPAPLGDARLVRVMVATQDADVHYVRAPDAVLALLHRRP